MPLFRYYCERCSREVALFLSLGEVSRGAAACPDCKAKDLKGPLDDAPGTKQQEVACGITKKS